MVSVAKAYMIAKLFNTNSWIGEGFISENRKLTTVAVAPALVCLVDLVAATVILAVTAVGSNKDDDGCCCGGKEEEAVDDVSSP